MSNAKITLVSREHSPDPVQIRVGNAVIGGDQIVIIAGPGAIESKEQLLETARTVKAAGADILRGGAFKTAASPYDFQGLGTEGLELLALARQETGLPIITEVIDAADVPLVASYADILQVGSLNSENEPLLRAVAETGKPVLLKRGFSSTIDEFLEAAEFVASLGNPNIILCERGLRGFDPRTSNVLDLCAVPLLRWLTSLPIIVDPSHATGHWGFVPPMSRAAIASGADGVMIEVHPRPHEARSDGQQSLLPARFAQLAADLRRMSAVIGDFRSVEDFQTLEGLVGRKA